MSRFRTPYNASQNEFAPRMPRGIQSPEKSAGMKNIRRDMSGKVVGATTPEGVGIGENATKDRRSAGSMFPRLERGVQTPMIDAYKAGQRPQAPQPPMIQPKDTRQGLFRDMVKSGSGGITPAMKQRGAQLGITPQQWNNGMRKLPAAPGAIAQAQPVTTSPAPALTGRAKANADIAKMGNIAASEKFLAERNAEKNRANRFRDSKIAKSY